MTSFFDKLNDATEAQKKKKEHPITEKLKELPENKQVNPPQAEEGVKSEKKPPVQSKVRKAEDTDLVIYIDCLLVNEDMILLADFIRPVTEAIEKENQVEHWSFCEYGKGNGMLTKRLARYIEKENPSGNVYVNSSSQEGRVCLETLRRFAARVAQGIR